MAYLEKKLYNGTPGAISVTLYTVPASTTTILKEIVVCNTTAAAQTVTVLADGTALLSGVSVPANDVLTLNVSVVLDAGDLVTATTSCSLFVSGIEVT